MAWPVLGGLGLARPWTILIINKFSFIPIGTFSEYRQKFHINCQASFQSNKKRQKIFKYCVTKFFLFLVDDKDDDEEENYRVMCCPIDFAEAYKQASGITEVDLHRDHRISAALVIN